MKVKCVHCSYEVDAGCFNLMMFHLKDTHPMELALLIMSKFTISESQATKEGT